MSAVLPWQQKAWSQLRSAARANRLPHAWLLAGPAGTGRHLFAGGMTGLLLCEQKTSAGEACGHCASCHLLSAGHHPDLIRLRPDEGKSQIAVESLREAMARLALTSHRGGRRVLLVEPADALNDNGVNALLKTLEEPPAAAHLILITERLMGLKATLRSRCQILRSGVPTPEQGMNWLQQHQPALTEEIRRAFVHSPLLAGAQIEQEAWEPEAWTEMLNGLGQALHQVGVMSEKSAKQQLLPCLRWLMRETTQSLRDHLRGGNVARPLFKRLSAAALSDWLLDAAQAHRALSGQSTVNARLLLESLMIGLYEKASAKQ